MLENPSKKFDVSPFVASRCKTPIEEIQAAVDGAISKEKAIKLKQCISHIDELEIHKSNIETEIFIIAEQFSVALDYIRTIPGLNKNPITAISIFLEIGGDMSVFPKTKHIVSRAGCSPRNDQSNKKVKSRQISQVSCYRKPILVQMLRTNAHT